ncbi:hypothetical protein AAD001_09470 [Colwelliaceae bacterium 6471]
MDNEEIVQVGGSIEKALKGDYQLDIKSVLREAWQTTVASRLSINVGLLFTLIIGMVTSYVISSTLGGIEAVANDPQSFMFLNIVVTLVVWPFLAGVEMMGVFHSVGLKTESRLVFAFLKRGSWVAVCALLTSLLVSIGLELLVLPGVYLAVALSFSIPLVVEKRLSPIKAIVLGIQATRFQWFKIFAIYLVLIFALIAVTIPLALTLQSDLSIIATMFFLFSLTYLAPMFYNVKGILYREIFGLQLKTVSGSIGSSDNIFSA